MGNSIIYTKCSKLNLELNALNYTLNSNSIIDTKCSKLNQVSEKSSFHLTFFITDIKCPKLNFQTKSQIKA